MARARLTSVAAAALFGLATAIIAGQGQGQGRGGQAPGGQAPEDRAAGDRHPRMRHRSAPIPRWRRVKDAADRRFRRREPQSKVPNGMTGEATLYEIANGGNGHMVQIVLTVQNAPPGIHGVHIHGTGRCEGPDFKSAGGHFDPGPCRQSRSRCESPVPHG